MKIFTADQIRAWDAYTIAHEPIASLDLMNRAAAAFTDWFTARYPDTERPVVIFAGPGNNGGDGLAIARDLFRRCYAPKVLVCDFGAKRSADFSAQLEALPKDIELVFLQHAASTWRLDELIAHSGAAPVIIDALFGTGLSRPLEGDWAEVVSFINALPFEVVSVDLPSGLLADAPTQGPCIEADRCFSFQSPKMAFFFPENADRIGEWEVGDIGLLPAFAEQTATPFYFLGDGEVRGLVRPRHKFSHKGSYGHALLVSGSYGKVGAAVLAARACLRAGVGLLTVHAPRCANVVLQTAVPEAMFSPDAGGRVVKDLPEAGSFSAVGIGPGLGTAPETAQALETCLQQLNDGENPPSLVLDADALNLLAQHLQWWNFIPKNSIITPHPKEFERLFGPSEHSFSRLHLLREKAMEHGIVIVLKGAHTAIALPGGACWFNSTGNPGMATGGSGDVLTGLLTGLVAQGYAPEEAALLGVFLHGLAGDLAAAEHGQPGMNAGDIGENLGAAWLRFGA